MTIDTIREVLQYFVITIYDSTYAFSMHINASFKLNIHTLQSFKFKFNFTSLKTFADTYAVYQKVN